MNIYNILTSSIIYIIIILIIEGLVYFYGLSIILTPIFMNLASNFAESMNKLVNKNYNTIVNKLNSMNFEVNNNDNLLSSLFNLYLIGNFNKEIIKEDNYIIENDIKSYISYTILIASAFGLLLIVYIVNYIYLNNAYRIDWKYNILNIILSVLLLLIFILPIIFNVFLYIEKNININGMQFIILSNIKKLLQKD